MYTVFDFTIKVSLAAVGLTWLPVVCFAILIIEFIFMPLLGVYNGPDRTGLAVDAQTGPNIAACCCVNGRGLSIFDLRMPLPLDFIYDVSCAWFHLSGKSLKGWCCLF